MSAMSSIEWTDRTWNPTRGCSIVSPGCVNCYAMKQGHRFSGPGRPYEGLTKLTPRSGPQWTGVVRTVDEALLDPLSWRLKREPCFPCMSVDGEPCPACGGRRYHERGLRVFVDSMSDLFHEDVPDAFIDRVFAVMALAPRHTFQILTKRAERMRAYVVGAGLGVGQSRRGFVIGRAWSMLGQRPLTTYRHENVAARTWPLPNVWLGVSVEDTDRLQRIDVLKDTPAAVHFVSMEPLLEDLGAVLLDGIEWVIVGGESGPGARPFEIAWGRSIVKQCKAAGVAVFVKQLGARAADIARPTNVTEAEAQRWMADGWCRVYSPAGLFFTKHPRLKHSKGGDPSEWPEDLRVRDFPRSASL